jgi:hypothetical protein
MRQISNPKSMSLLAVLNTGFGPQCHKKKHGGSHFFYPISRSGAFTTFFQPDFLFLREEKIKMLKADCLNNSTIH